jgi:hypothetical protein
METGIDKLEITTTDYQVNRWESSGLILRPSMVKAGIESEPDAFVLVDKFGKRIVGEKVFLNHALFNITINQYGMRLTTNPSKPYHPINLVSDDKTLHERFENVVSTLKEEHGIIFNLDGSKLTRVDTAKNVELINPVSSYIPIFSTLRLPRSTHQAQYPDGFQTGNNARTCILYNKGEEQKKDNPDIFDLYGNRLMRGEFQVKKAGIHTHLGLKVFQDLKNFGIQHLKDKYSDWMAKQIFSVRTIGETKFIPFGASIEMMLKFKELHPQSWEKKYRSLFGLDELITLHGGIDGYIQSVCEVAGHNNRKTPNKVRKELLQLQQLRTEIVENSFGSLYSELKRKFVA